MKEHILKCWPEPFQAIRRGVKPFEFRRNDRDFRVGDILKLREFDPETNRYTGAMLWQEVTYVLAEGFGVPPGFAVLGIAPRSDLLTTIKEFARWHHLNESTIAERETPSDSEIDAEVEAWTTIKRAITTMDQLR
ncbi:DUF3850 domain-containing protein [Rhizobium sp. 1AS11]|uniref:DUF3850 domain-containing protein n=1 Tax=Rhizobium acaciae TaxID=2989736 RepID=UPI002223A8AB|nr:DUF3850 domain-containing protein [Rhizobium acaciae]MCW1412185.1 DUF3850 domain-containing protein [Rhizobium acaciae]MCW1744200.1 DUF3850 domain-containing protein [Rhizobium acaciae]